MFQMPSDVSAAQAVAAVHFRGPKGPWMEHLMQDEGLGAEQAHELLSHFEILPCDAPNIGHAATVIRRGNEIHLAVYRKYRKKGLVTRSALARVLTPLLEKHGWLVTRFGPGEDSSFAEKVGFIQLSATIDGTRTFILTHLRGKNVTRKNLRTAFAQRHGLRHP